MFGRSSAGCRPSLTENATVGQKIDRLETSELALVWYFRSGWETKKEGQVVRAEKIASGLH